MFENQKRKTMEIKDIVSINLRLRYRLDVEVTAC